MAGYNLGEARGKVVLETDTSSLPKAEDAVENFKRKTENTASGVARSWDTIAKVSAIGATAAAAAFSLALGNAINTEAMENKVAASLDLTEEESARAGKVAGTLYSQAYGESMEQVQGAVESVIGSIRGMRDASESELQAITAQVLDMASAFEIDVARATQVVGQMISSGMVADAQSGIDLLTAALQKVPPAVREDILDAVDEYGPFFTAVGMSGEEAMDALVQASEKGMYGIDKTGDAVKEFGIRATDMSAASVAAYEAAGLNAEEMAAKILAGGDTAKDGFNEIINGLLGIEDPTARANAAIGLFGTPLEDLGVNEIPQFLEGLQGMTGSLGDVEGAAERMGSKLNAGVGVSWTTILRTFEMVATQAAAGLLPVLGEIAAWAAANPAAIQGVATALGAVAIAFGVVTAATVAWRTATTITSAVVGAFQAVQLGLTAATYGTSGAMVVSGASAVVYRAAMIAQQVATGLATAAQWAFNAAMSANPIGIIITLIAALVAGLIWFFTQTELGQQIWSGFMTWLQEAWANVSSFLTTVWEGIVAVATTVWEGVMTVVEAVVSWFQTYVQPTIDAVINAIVGYFEWYFSMVDTVWKMVQIAIKAVVNWFKTNVQPAIDAFIKFISKLFEFFGDVITLVWNAIMTTIRTVVSAIVSYVTERFNAVKNFFQTIWNAIKLVFTTVWNAIVAFLTPIINNIASFIRTTWQGVSSFLSGLFNGIASFIRTIWQGISNTINGIVRGVTDFIRNTWSGITGFVSTIFNNVKNAIKGPLEAALDFIGGIKDKIVGFFSGAGSWLVNAGRNIIQGFLDGLNAMLSNITGFFSNLTNMIPDIKGPEERDKVLLTKNGRLIMQSLYNGLDKELGSVTGLLSGLNATIPASINQEIAANVAGGGRAPITINVTWHAAAGDGVSTRSQVMEMLGHAKDLLREGVNSNG